MSRTKAITICNNLLQTISKTTNSSSPSDSFFEANQTKREKLKKIYDRLVKKYKIEDKEISFS
tara:strand:- start:3476 stop:3664 length:189 start_codon:yes stop_codon:yes gene_type:complete